jgi:glycosyltransferase involved in cell wall biosynthesis
MENITVSIILPLYNGENFIEQTLESIARQSFTDSELIIVDDGSTDNSCTIIKRISSESEYPILKNLQILSKENGGVASARNFGIKATKGKYLAFIDQDDLWVPQKLEQQIAALESSTATWCYSSYLRFYADGREKIRKRGSSDRIKTLGSLVFGKLFIPPSTVLIEKSVCEEEGGFVSEFTPSDEWDLFLTLAEKHAPVYCPEVLVRFRSHSASTAKKQKRKIFDAQLKVLEKHFSKLKANGFQSDAKKRKANVLWHIGKEYESEGKKKLARKYYAESLRNNPTRVKLLASYFRCLMK